MEQALLDKIAAHMKSAMFPLLRWTASAGLGKSLGPKPSAPDANLLPPRSTTFLAGAPRFSDGPSPRLASYKTGTVCQETGSWRRVLVGWRRPGPPALPLCGCGSTRKSRDSRSVAAEAVPRERPLDDALGPENY
jgi:hypothetical protein